MVFVCFFGRLVVESKPRIEATKGGSAGHIYSWAYGLVMTSHNSGEVQLAEVVIGRCNNRENGIAVAEAFV